MLATWRAVSSTTSSPGCGIETVLGFADLALKGFEARGKVAHFQLFGGGQTQLIGLHGLTR